MQTSLINNVQGAVNDVMELQIIIFLGEALKEQRIVLHTEIRRERQ